MDEMSPLMRRTEEAIADWLDYLGSDDLGTQVRTGAYRDPSVMIRVQQAKKIRDLERDLAQAKRDLAQSMESLNPPTVVKVVP